MSTTNYDLIIVGGGLVGASLAALLTCPGAQDSGLRIALVEAGSGPQESDPSSGFGSRRTGFDPRVVALTRQSQQLLQTANAWPAIEAMRACAYTDMHVWDGDGTASIHFNAWDIGETNLGHIVENRVLLAAVYQQLQAQNRVAMHFNAEVETLAGESDARQLILASGEVLAAPLIVAADGARSKLRELAAFDVRQWSYGHSAVVTTVETEKPHQFTAWQRFMTSGPLAFLPLQQAQSANVTEHHCSIVWSLQTELAEEIMALETNEFNQALGCAFEYKLGAIRHSDPRYSFPLTARLARDYYRQGLVLVGDAAHSIHPLAGQGVNLGLLDVAVLAEELQRAQRRGIPLNDESILRRYQRRRKGHNLATLATMEGFKRLFGAEPLAIRWLRNAGLRGVNQQAWLKNQIAKQMLGTQHEFNFGRA